MTGNLDMKPADWLAECFAHEYCAECGGDTEHHTAVVFMGNWFARCDFPGGDTSPVSEENWHPVIRAFRQRMDAGWRAGRQMRP
jgi:hypothetical protein